MHICGYGRSHWLLGRSSRPLRARSPRGCYSYARYHIALSQHGSLDVLIHHVWSALGGRETCHAALEEGQRIKRLTRDPLLCSHGWGCAPNPQAAVNYLSAAASNAATVENLALQAGLKKGGAAKGELVLAIFELANCFRHGWGIPKDPIAAKQVGRFRLSGDACGVPGA